MKIALLISFVTVLGIGTALLAGCTATFGSRPSEADRERFAHSPNYDKAKSRFVNQNQSAVDKMDERMDFLTLLKLQFQSVADAVPGKPLPVAKPDIKAFMEPSDRIKAIWLGHSSLLFRINGKAVLVDPVLSNYAAPFSFMIKRFQPAVLSLDELPPIDFVVISHDHYEHLDIASIKFFVGKKTEFVVPLGVGSHLTKWGIEPTLITELDWWDKHERDGISFVATPAQHYSGRLRRGETLWSGWVIESNQSRVFYSGDSGYADHFKEVGKRLGPFDAAFIDIGQYNDLWREIHLHPEESVQAFIDVNAKHFVPVHWAAFSLAKHSWQEPINRVTEISKSKGVSVLTPKIGEPVTLTGDAKTQAWWNSL